MDHYILFELFGMIRLTIFNYVSQIWTEMQIDFLPNFILCNTTQRFVRSSKVPLVPVQKPSVPYAKPNFYCGTQVRNDQLNIITWLDSLCSS